MGRWTGLVITVLLLAACSREAGHAAGGDPGGAHPLRAVVTIAPLGGLVRPLLPAGAELTVLMPPGRSEHGYEFSPADMALAGSCDLLVYVGLNLEPRLRAAVQGRPSPARRVVC